MKKVHLNLSIDERVAHWLKVYAAEQGMTVSELIELWAKDRMALVDDDYGGLNEKRCIYCGRRILGYGAICPDCKQEPTPEERERLAELWRKAKEELDELIKLRTLK